jgi:hypothetical protein
MCEILDFQRDAYPKMLPLSSIRRMLSRHRPALALNLFRSCGFAERLCRISLMFSGWRPAVVEAPRLVADSLYPKKAQLRPENSD